MTPPDQTSFQALVEPHRSAVRLHCYRMLGSSHDSDDMVQETLLRAFRAQGTLSDSRAVRGWLYRIATNVCLDELQKRPRRARGPELSPPSDPEVPPAAPTDDGEWIEPMPSAWLDGARDDPDAAYTLKESVALAFVAALQVLTPPQRAVLLLRDVVGLSAEESAAALELSVSATNSALHRARAALEARVGPRGAWSPAPDAPVDRALLARYLAAWESGELDAIVAVLHDDAVFSMPPYPTWLSGRAAIRHFFARHLSHRLHPGAFRVVHAAANGAPTFAFYRAEADGAAHLFAIHVMALRDGRVAVIDHFMNKAALPPFGLPATCR